MDLLEERARKGGGARASSVGARVPPDYVRKHNPLIMFDSVAKNESRVRNIKGLEAFYEDLENRTLPQWSFITPNMVSQGFFPLLFFSFFQFFLISLHMRRKR